MSEVINGRAAMGELTGSTASTDTAPDLPRCPWAGSDPLMIAYHDTEWGVPCHDDQQLFERLMLEGFQAGLSWSTILCKRANFARAFDQWNPEIIAAYQQPDLDRLLADPGIVRNRLKINAAVENAQAYLRVQETEPSFDHFLWNLVGDLPDRPRPVHLGDLPALTPEAERLSKTLKQRGFTFVGPTICYAFMQSVGMVDDHLTTCFRAQAETVAT